MGKPMYVGDGVQWLSVAGGGSMGGMTPVWSRSFSAEPSVSIDGCFTTRFRKYRVICMLDTLGTNISHSIRLRAGGADASGANYIARGTYGGTASGNVSASGQTEWTLSTASAGRWLLTMDIFDPQAAAETVANAMVASGASTYMNALSLWHSLATAYDGFTIYPASGSISGSITVYGLEDTVLRPIPGRDRLWTPQMVHGANDEFNDGVLDAAWVRVDAAGGSGRVTWAEGADSLSMRQNGGDAATELHGLVKPYALAVGEYVQTYLRGVGRLSNYPMAGPVICDGTTHGAGNQLHTGRYLASGFNGVATGRWTGWNARPESYDDGTFQGLEMHFRILRDVSNVWRFYTSADAVLWDEIRTITYTMTPTHVGVAGGTWGGATPFSWSFDYFRVGS